MANIVGLILNCIGGIFIAVSIGKYSEDGAPYTELENGKKLYIAYVTNIVLFRIGIVLFIIGTIIQIVYQIIYM